MVKMIIGFILLFTLVFCAIEGFSAISGQEKIQWIKSLGYSMLVTAIVFLIIATIVILF